MSVFIYGLVCPVSGQIRYIGKTNNPRVRLRAHITTSEKCGTAKGRWVASVLSAGLEPTMRILRQLGPNDDWSGAEREEIANARAAGLPLTNATSGGQGCPLSKAGRRARIKALENPKIRANMSRAAKARWADPVKAAAGRLAMGSPESRANYSKAAKKRATPDYRALMSERSRAAWADPSKRARIEAGITDEVKAQVSAASKAMWSDPDKAKKCSANIIGQQTSEAAASRWSSDEYRQKQSATRRTKEYKTRATEGQLRAWKKRHGES